MHNDAERKTKSISLDVIVWTSTTWLRNPILATKPTIWCPGPPPSISLCPFITKQIPARVLYQLGSNFFSTRWHNHYNYDWQSIRQSFPSSKTPTRILLIFIQWSNFGPVSSFCSLLLNAVLLIILNRWESPCYTLKWTQKKTKNLLIWPSWEAHHHLK